ncbi:MAG: MerR family transcriptional regulator [Bacteroidaceae bacterium]|nr:MerR family transcriptional regulator [Bacteroidaceae bacterium]
MPLNSNKILKKYYSIHEVAQQFGVNESTLRYWEQEFPRLKPHKAGRGVRQYTAEDIELVKVIHNLVKVRGLKLAAARQLLIKNKGGEQNIAEAVKRLQAVRQQLVELRRNLSVLESDEDEWENLAPAPSLFQPTLF